MCCKAITAGLLCSALHLSLTITFTLKCEVRILQCLQNDTKQSPPPTKKNTPTKAGIAFFCNQVDWTRTQSYAAGGRINAALIPGGHYCKEMSSAECEDCGRMLAGLVYEGAKTTQLEGLGSGGTQNDDGLLAVHNAWDLEFNWEVDSYRSRPLNSCTQDPRLLSVTFVGTQCELNSLIGVFAAAVFCPCRVSLSAQH